MGPFKHPVDDGLDIRKAAFECMYTLLETCLERIDVYVFLEHVEEGLKDHYDIKMLTYLMLARLARLCPQAVLQRYDQILNVFHYYICGTSFFFFFFFFQISFCYLSLFCTF